VRRFRAEAEAIARLDHPHIVPLYEIGKRRGRHFFSMLLVESGSLMTHMPRLQKDHRRAAQVMAAVARAVHYAHQHGILHRDLKPANVLLDAEDQPYVSDFGLARDVGDKTRLTQTGAVVGTPSYMAPEQATGGGAKGSPEADVYSLGAILYELLTGQPPFAGETALATLQLSQKGNPRTPRSMNRKASADLEAICLKCLEKDPGRRYPTAEALALDLERFLRDEPVGARPRTLLSGAVRWARRRPGPARLLALAAVLLLAWVTGSLVMATRLYRLRPPPPNDPPVVVLMDTPADRGVYDLERRGTGGTNADVLNDRLDGMGLDLVKEPVAADWHREAHVLGLRPELVVIHRSCFFHALNKKFDFHYPNDEHEELDPNWKLLYATADDKLVGFLGLLATANPRTQFLVYSRGTDRQWPQESYRKKWVDDAELRFPALKGRIKTQFITGGLKDGTFTNSNVAEDTRRNVRDLVGRAKSAR